MLCAVLHKTDFAFGRVAAVTAATTILIIKKCFAVPRGIEENCNYTRIVRGGHKEDKEYGCPNQ